MKHVLQLEELGLFLLALFLFLQTDLSWWWFPALILTPDISMLGYLANAKTGARIYNTFHHKGLAVVVMFAGHFGHLEALYVAGLIMLAHASLDRIFGYGLKLFKGFNFTHLGEITH